MDLGVEDRLAGGDQPTGDPALRVGPAHDVDETEVAEGEVGVAAVEAQELRAEHEPVGEAGGKDERQIDLEVRLLGQRGADRLGLDHAHAVELPALAEDLEEAPE